MSNELNEYLKEKGVSNDIRNKRMLATAFGLIFDASTPEQESALLLALKVGAMATGGKIKESFVVTVAFKDDYWVKFDKLEDAEKEMNAIVEKGFAGQVTRQIIVSHLEKTVYPKAL